MSMRLKAIVPGVVLVFALGAIASAGAYTVWSTLQVQATLGQSDDAAANDAVAVVDDADGTTAAAAQPPAATQPVDDAFAPVPIPAAIDNGIPVRLTRVSQGQMESAERADLQLINNAEVLDVQPVGQGGVVQLVNINDGVYSLLARGSDGFATGRTALRNNGEVPQFGLIPWVDMPAVEPVLQRDVYDGATQATLGAPVAQEGWGDILYGTSFAVDANGVVSGRVSKSEALDAQPLAVVGSKVLFIRAGRVVAQGVTDELGEFEISGLQPGIHTFVAASNLGLLGVSTTIEDESAGPGIAGRPRAEIRFVAGGVGASGGPTPPGDIQAGGGTGQGQGDGQGTAGTGGGGGGGTGGGTGGGSGGGGIGGGDGFLPAILGGLAGAAIGAAAADDDNPASP
jgi:hypothetical protein